MLAAGLLLLAGTQSSHAELAIFVTGDWLKIESHTLLGDQIQLLLPEGGSVTVSLERIERILDDEIVPEKERVQATTAGDFDLHFDAHHSKPKGELAVLIFETARRFDLNPDLMMAMTRAESAFDREAVSHKGALGLMQLMPATAERFGVAASELFVPERNLEAGASYLRWLIDRFEGDLIKVLAAYNAGEGAVDRYGGVPPYRETQGYVKKIVGYLGLTS